MWDLQDTHIIQQIESLLGYSFKDLNLLKEAFTHSSLSDDPLHSNERLEFLGDAILGAVICEHLYRRLPHRLEGDLTRAKSDLVSRRTCASVARKLGLTNFLRLGKGMTGPRGLPRSVQAGLFEAVIGAIYIDGGFDAAKGFIMGCLGPVIETYKLDEPGDNYKSILQHYAQERFGVSPVYVLLDEKGPDHHKCFESEVVLDTRHFPSAWGVSKKEAEQRAAYNALLELGLLDRSARPPQDQ
ncbi:MAG: ribonuclease III [Sedimentisphaerales bacterium]|nr:ribonuclease III [Sedimentisphaerales bacterium]